MASLYSLSFLFFVLLIFFILIRASIIDIKTMFVPLNIIVSIYFSSILSVFVLGHYLTSILGLLIGTIPLVIISFLLRRHVSEEIVLNENTDTKKFRPILYLLLFMIGLLILLNSVEKGLIYLTGSIIIFFIFKYITSSLKTFLYLVGTLSCFVLFEVNVYLLILVPASILSEYTLSVLFKKFDDTEKLIKEEKDIMIKGGEVYGAIGFGDILIFGALGLFVGIKYLMPILFFSGIFHLCFALFYFLYTGNRQKSLPFIPGIAFSIIYFFSSLDLLGLKESLFSLL